MLPPALYLALLAGSSLLHGWGGGAKYALVSELLPVGERLAGNAVLSTSGWASTIAGPALAGALATVISPAWIIGLDALSFAFLAVQAGRVPESKAPASPLAAQRLRDGWRILVTSPELLGLLALTWLFNFFYGPVEVALPLFVGAGPARWREPARTVLGGLRRRRSRGCPQHRGSAQTAERGRS